MKEDVWKKEKITIEVHTCKKSVFIAVAEVLRSYFLIVQISIRLSPKVSSCLIWRVSMLHVQCLYCVYSLCIIFDFFLKVCHFLSLDLLVSCVFLCLLITYLEIRARFLWNNVFFSDII